MEFITQPNPVWSGKSAQGRIRLVSVRGKVGARWRKNRQRIAAMRIGATRKGRSKYVEEACIRVKEEKVQTGVK